MLPLFVLCTSIHFRGRSVETAFCGFYKVQRRATRLTTSDKSLSYHDGLQKFGLTTLKTRRLRGDLIEVFKMFKGFDNITLNDFFKLSSTTLRGHTLKIYKPQVHLGVRNFFFTVRIIDVWNSLPISLINCETIATLKNILTVS